MNRQFAHTSRWWVLAASLAALLLILAVGGESQTAQASLYWAAANGVTPSPLTEGIQSSTPTVCFVGNAVDVRLARVSQIIQYIRRFEWAGNIRFMSPAGHPLADELGAGGNANNLKCPASVPAGGKDYFAGDIRVVLPFTNVDATTPVPGTGCMTDKLISAPACVARDSSHIDCFARGADNSTWGKHWNSTDGWGGWDQALGGTTDALPAAASLSASNLEVVAKGVADSALYIRSWNGSSWTSWAQIPGTSGNATSGAACVGHDGNRLTCAVRWSTGYIYVADRNSGTWGAWVATNLSTPAGYAPTITIWGSGRLDVFARGLGIGQAAMMHVWSTNYGATWTPGVENLGGSITGAPACIGRQPVGADGKLDCFARGGDGNLWKRSYPGGSLWDASWVSLGMAATGDPAVSVRSGTLLDVFAAGPDGALWQTSSNGGSTWGTWTNLGANNGWGSWSNPPWTRNESGSRACLYNLKLGDNPWCSVNGESWPCASEPDKMPYLDHTLHEFGHAMGLAHEHQRNDTDPTCVQPGYGGGASAGKLTPYDRASVMNYNFPACGIEGNFGYNGLSYYDQLGLHMMYPPAGLPAEISGKTTLQTGETLSLTAGWKAAGANMTFAATNFVWKVDGITRSTGDSLSLGGLAAGSHPVTLVYDDFLNRHYSYSGVVRVLSPTNFDARVSDLLAVQNMIVTQDLYFINLPSVTR